MQAVYNILTRIKDQLKKDVNVNTVTFGDIFAVDLSKQTIYPLSHIILNGAGLEGDTLNVWRFNMSVMCMDIVDISKESETDIFIGNDNEQDVLNTQHAVLARLLSVLSNEDNLFDLDGEPDLEPFFDSSVNKLTGWTATFDILVPNTVPTCDETDIMPICSNGTATNSNDTYSLSVPSGGVADIPDTTYIINYGGTSTSFDLPTLSDEIITFNFT